MKLTLLEEKKQPMLLRKELIYTLDYPQASTPSKIEVMKLIVRQSKIDEQLLVLDTIQPTFGDTQARVTVAAYASKDALRKFSGVNKRKAKDAEKKEAAPVKEAAPKVEEKKEEKKEAPAAKEEQAPAEEKKE